MYVKSDFRAPDDALTGAACRGADTNPEWWVNVHATLSHKACQHALARHICRFHCPVLERCLAQKDEWGTDWEGMVYGGVLWALNGRTPQPASVQPRGPSICPLCVKRTKL